MDSVAAPLVAGIENDPEVREAIKGLALSAIAHAKEMLDTAAPQQQLQMLRILIPPLTRTVGKSDEKGDEDLRTAVGEMYKGIIAATGGDDDGQ